MKNRQKGSAQAWTIVIVVLLIVIAGFYYYKNTKQGNLEKDSAQQAVINSVTFNCSENKTIQALFFKEKVELTLSDGRNMLLPQAISASGARYANADESFVFWNKGNTAFVQEGDKTTFKDCSISNPEANNSSSTTQIANPASVNCKKLGGELVIQKKDNGEYGLCYFEDNKACEEWALFRSECPVGGVKTTGFDTMDQKFCVWSGGQTSAVTNSVCTFKNGSKCPTIGYYNGTCSPTSN